MTTGLRPDEIRDALGYIDWIADVAADWPSVDENYQIVAAAARAYASVLDEKEGRTIE